MSINTYNYSPIFCKPIPVDYKDEILHEQYFPSNGYHISFRSIQLDTDIDMIHDWVNREYAHEFWQLNKPKQEVYQTYHDIINNPDGHSFIGLINHEPICQVDLYRILADEVKQHIEAGPDDSGMHLLMAPIDKLQKGLTKSVLYSFLSFYFSFPMAQRIYGEPDIRNHKAIMLMRSTGFQFQKNIIMSYKTAALHCCTKESFIKNNL
jgi:acetyl CoA:N6-hydroxylysine acetyl transferase